MMVALCSDKGSPGVTTTAVALASTWPQPAIVVEVDAYGGDLAMRLRTREGAVLAETPTVLSVATAARTTTDSHMVARYAQPVNDQVLVVPGHGAAEQAGGVPDWAPLGRALSVSAWPVLADLGRLHGGSPVLPVAAAADVIVVVARTDTASVVRLRERLARLVPAVAAVRGSAPRVFPVLLTRARYGPGDVADVRRILADTPAGPFLAGVAHVSLDPAGVERLIGGGHVPTGRLARSPLLKSARRISQELCSLVQDTARVPMHLEVR